MIYTSNPMMMRDWSQFSLVLLTILCLTDSVSVGGKKNVVFIAVDDLRPQLGCYGQQFMVTPNLDRFAQNALLFNRHYVQVATCGASRFALMTGRYPRQPMSLKNNAFQLLREQDNRFTTIPQIFRKSGYRTVSLGKISHSPDGLSFAKESKGQKGKSSPEMPNAWDVVGSPTGIWKNGWSAFFAYAGGKSRTRGRTPAWEAAVVDNTGYPDGLIAEAASAEFEKLISTDQPFFLAVGFFKPHLPFCAPKRYWDLYDADTIPLESYRHAPNNVDAKVSLHNSGELFGNYGQHPANARVDAAYARKLRHAYFAAVSYVDAQIGKLLDVIEKRSPENTIVVIWGDHGWHLGNHGIWGKHTPYEVALRSALLIRVPNSKANGRVTSSIVESIDIRPTLTDLCGLGIDSAVDGKSFANLFDEFDTSADDFAIGFWKNRHLASTIRNDRYRFIRWSNEKSGNIVQRELYDHASDPHETNNIASTLPNVVSQLEQQLEQQFGHSNE